MRDVLQKIQKNHSSGIVSAVVSDRVELYIRLFHVPNYLLPGPAELADSMVKLFVSGDIMKHIRVTMEEILMGP